MQLTQSPLYLTTLPLQKRARCQCCLAPPSEPPQPPKQGYAAQCRPLRVAPARGAAGAAARDRWSCPRFSHQRARFCPGRGARSTARRARRPLRAANPTCGGPRRGRQPRGPPLQSASDPTCSPRARLPRGQGGAGSAAPPRPTARPPSMARRARTRPRPAHHINHRPSLPTARPNPPHGSIHPSAPPGAAPRHGVARRSGGGKASTMPFAWALLCLQSHAIKSRQRRPRAIQISNAYSGAVRGLAGAAAAARVRAGAGQHALGVSVTQLGWGGGGGWRAGRRPGRGVRGQKSGQAGARQGPLRGPAAPGPGERGGVPGSGYTVRGARSWFFLGGSMPQRGRGLTGSAGGRGACHGVMCRRLLAGRAAAGGAAPVKGARASSSGGRARRLERADAEHGAANAPRQLQVLGHCGAGKGRARRRRVSRGRRL
jgi:hypothetical protein